MDAKTWPRGVAALAAAVALAVLCTSAARASAAKIDLRRCSNAKDDPTRCGRLSVPLDRSGGVRGRVSLKVRVLSSRTRRANGTIFALAGGPGQAAAPLIGSIAQMLGPALKTRRLVAFDQRGTGGSGRLSCPGLARAGSEQAIDRAVAGCAQRLGARRIGYTSAASVDDVEAVRAALGIDRIVIYGVSYGTKVALDYAARHPQHVSRLVLDSLLLPARLLGSDGGGDLDPTSDSEALFIATSCEDGGVPWPAGTPLGERAAATRAALGLVVQGYSYIPGVTLNARLAIDADDPDAPLVLRIGGAAAAPGTLTFSDTRISGTLGGQRISVRADDGGGAGAASLAHQDSSALGSRAPRGGAAATPAQHDSSPVDPRLAAAARRSPVSRATLREALARARRLASPSLGAPPLPVVPPGSLDR